MPKINEELAFAAIGNFGVEVATDDSYVHVRIPLNGKAYPSSTGKMSLKGSTGGWQVVPGTDLRVSIMAGSRVG